MDECYDLPDLDTGPVGLQHSSWVLALASRPMDVFCVVFVSLFPVMLLPVYCYCTSRRPCECLESYYVSVQVMYLLDMLFLN